LIGPEFCALADRILGRIVAAVTVAAVPAKKSRRRMPDAESVLCSTVESAFWTFSSELAGSLLRCFVIIFFPLLSFAVVDLPGRVMARQERRDSA
jgi:hypothetical protein